MARNGREMKLLLLELLHTPSLAGELAARGRRRILERHTCAHRVDELLGIVATLDGQSDADEPREGLRSAL
jgi:spore maturation protein CgeB